MKEIKPHKCARSGLLVALVSDIAFVRYCYHYYDTQSTITHPYTHTYTYIVISNLSKHLDARYLVSCVETFFALQLSIP